MLQERVDVGARVFLIESNRIVTEVVVSARRGEFYTVLLPGGGGIQVRRSRLFPTREAAESHLQAGASLKKKRFRSPYDF